MCKKFPISFSHRKFGICHEAEILCTLKIVSYRNHAATEIPADEYVMAYQRKAQNKDANIFFLVKMHQNISKSFGANVLSQAK